MGPDLVAPQPKQVGATNEVMELNSWLKRQADRDKALAAEKKMQESLTSVEAALKKVQADIEKQAADKNKK